MVLGAGRGPLVRATLNAADITNSIVKVNMYNDCFYNFCSITLT